MEGDRSGRGTITLHLPNEGEDLGEACPILSPNVVGHVDLVTCPLSHDRGGRRGSYGPFDGPANICMPATCVFESLTAPAESLSPVITTVQVSDERDTLTARTEGFWPPPTIRFPAGDPEGMTFAQGQKVVVVASPNIAFGSVKALLTQVDQSGIARDVSIAADSVTGDMATFLLVGAPGAAQLTIVLDGSAVMVSCAIAPTCSARPDTTFGPYNIVFQ